MSRARHGRFRPATIEHLESDLRRLAEDFSLRLLEAISKAPASEIPRPPPRRRRTRRNSALN